MKSETESLSHLKSLGVSGVGALEVGSTKVGELHILASPTYLYFRVKRNQTMYLAMQCCLSELKSVQTWTKFVSDLTLEIPAVDTRSQVLSEPFLGRWRLASPPFCAPEIMEHGHDPVHRLPDHVDHIHLEIKLIDTGIEVSGDARLEFFLSPSRSFLGTRERVMT